MRGRHAILGILLALSPAVAAAQAKPPAEDNSAMQWEKMFQRDSSGFTVFPLGDDAQVVLLSTSDGSDFYDGVSKPVRTLKKALSLVRPGTADRILFKRGDIFDSAQLNDNLQVAGRSPQEPMVIGAYGDPRYPRPVLEGQLGLGAKVWPRFVVLQSLDLYADSRDPSLPTFDVNHQNQHQSTGIRMVCPGTYLWIEDCQCRDFGMGIILQSHQDNLFHTLIIRRCQVVDNWDIGHSSGLYVENFDGVLIEENLFDHNGWNDSVPGAGKTIFNHNMYLQRCEVGENRHFIVRGNISARASSHGCQLRPGGFLENNLFLKNPLAAFVSYAPSVVKNNVVLDGDSIGPSQPRGSGLEFLNCPTVLAEDNIIAHKSDRINSGSAMDYNPLLRDAPLPSSRGEFGHNIVFDWTGTAFLTLSTPAALSVQDNYFEPAGYGLIELAEFQSGFIFKNNWYVSKLPEPFRIAGQNMDPQDWQRRTGDVPEPHRVAFADPTRDIVSYAESIGLDTASLDGFLAAAREQRRGHWDSRLTAEAVNDYIRAGFALRPATQPSQ